MSSDGLPAVAVGMVGLGNMGMPVARRILAAGYPVHVYARRPEVRAEAARLGAITAVSLAELAEACDVLIINVFSDDQVRDVALGPEGLATCLRPDAVLVNHTTGRPSTVQAVDAAARRRGAAALDCAMSGGPADIDAGQLTLLVGGDQAVLEQVRPILASYGSPIIHVGAPGDAQKVKLLNNALFGAHVALVRRIEQAAVDLGMDPLLVLPAIGASSGSSYALRGAVAAGGAERLVAGARSYIRKDVGVCAEVAAELGVDLGLVLRAAQEI